MTRPPGLQEHVPLAPLTTLELGGPARYFVKAGTRKALVEALRWAEGQEMPVALLAGGSNLVVSDAGFPGLVVRVALRGMVVEAGPGRVRVSAAAGESWDWVVRRAVEENLAGIECLSGIPGTVGATPVQNVGAYGQEVGEVVESVRALDRRTLREVSLARSDCGFAYRSSRFRAEPDRFVVLAVTLLLTPGGAPALRYAELERAVGEQSATASLADVRRAVLDLRRSKSMLVDPADPNRRSVGSFFVNPVFPPEQVEEVARRALALGLVGNASEVPCFPAPDGRVKIPAAWLIEHAGFARGERRGAVGISSRHALALVHHGGGTTAELLALARSIRDRVEERWGVRLRPEPLFLGFPAGDPLE